MCKSSPDVGLIFFPRTPTRNALAPCTTSQPMATRQHQTSPQLQTSASARRFIHPRRCKCIATRCEESSAIATRLRRHQPVHSAAAIHSALPVLYFQNMADGLTELERRVHVVSVGCPPS